MVNVSVTGETLTVKYRKPDGTIARRSQRVEWSCFLAATDLNQDQRRALASRRDVASIREEGEWIRVRFHNRDARWQAVAQTVRTFDGERVAGLFAKLGLKPMEGDVPPEQRWLVDSDLELAQPKRCYLDLETDSRVPFSEKERARILCWAIVDDEDGRAIAATLKVDSDTAEKQLLEAMWGELAKFDQVLAWNGDRFDFAMIEARSRARNVQHDMRATLWLDHLELFRRMNASAAESGDEKQSMSLASVSGAVLGEEKLVDVAALDGGTWKLWQEDPALLERYCIDDAAKMYRIEQKTGYVALHQTVCETCHVLPNTKGINPAMLVDGYMMRLGKQRGMRFPTHYWRRDDEAAPESFAGAFVMAPTRRGIVTDVHVADFARLYPSIILSWNMSPETLRRDASQQEGITLQPSYLRHVPKEASVEKALPENCCVCPGNREVFANGPPGVLVEAIEEMLRLRKYWDDKKSKLPPGTAEWKEADRRSSAYKIMANMFFGVVGSPHSRHFVQAVAESITQAGVWLIRETIRAAEEKGMRVIYGDTDSLFVAGCTATQFESFVAWCNSELYPRLLREQGCARNEVKLAYEKAFDRIVFLAKKRYFGRYSHYKRTAANEDSKPEIKGIEIKRGDTTRLTRALQSAVVDLLLGGGVLRKRVEQCTDDPLQFEQLLDEWRARVLNGEVAVDEFVLSKRLGKPLHEYSTKRKKDGTDGAPPAHVAIARMLKQRGRDVGEGARIEYVVVDANSSPMKCIPREDYAGEFDRNYVWNSLAFEPTLRVLEAAFPTHDWKRWLAVAVRAKAVKQVGLFD